jgi:hypothetical protein
MPIRSLMRLTWLPITLLAAIVVHPAPGFAKDLDPTCNRDRDVLIPEILKKYDEVDHWVKRVPPEEREYMVTEQTDALKAQSEARLDALVARSYYRAWEFHDEIQDAKDAFVWNTNLPRDASPKERISSVASVLSPLARVTEAWDSYVESDNGKTMTQDQVGTGTVIVWSNITNLQRYIWCWANAL